MTHNFEGFLVSLPKLCQRNGESVALSTVLFAIHTKVSFPLYRIPQ
jgi:hypothetical protein